MTLGEKLSKLRKEYNYTQEQLADVLGVSRQSISKWESNIAYPETDKLIELGRLFECSMDYLLREEISEKVSTNPSGFIARSDELIKKIASIRNKSRAKKALKIAGIIFAIFFAIDVVSMAIYFMVF